MNTTHRNRAPAAPAYYLGRSAGTWQTALQRRRGHEASPTAPTARERKVAGHRGATS